MWLSALALFSSEPVVLTVLWREGTAGCPLILEILMTL